MALIKGFKLLTEKGVRSLSDGSMLCLCELAGEPFVAQVFPKGADGLMPVTLGLSKTVPNTPHEISLAFKAPLYARIGTDGIVHEMSLTKPRDPSEEPGADGSTHSPKGSNGRSGRP